jgi:hypothetical protein
MHRISPTRWTSLGSLACILTACGGVGNSTAPSPGPVITDLSGRFVSAGCVVSGRVGTALVGTVNFTDSDGDLAGGKAQITGTFLPSGPSTDRVSDIPSSSVTISGTTSGTVSAVLCVRFGSSTGIQFSVAVTDNAGHSSNVLSTSVSRPPGAPLVRSDAMPEVLGP